jgi:hypothetical protein
MTAYGKITTVTPAPLLTTDFVKEAKEARRKVLDAVFQRRRESYKRWYKKMQLQASNMTDTAQFLLHFLLLPCYTCYVYCRG